VRKKLLFIVIFIPFYSLTKPKKIKPQKKIIVKYTKKPFYYRFVPKLKTIKSKKIIVAQVEYDHPKLGSCTYNMVKDLKDKRFFGWCSTKKIPRKKTTIFQVHSNSKKLPLSPNKVELGLNEHMNEMMTKINKQHREVEKK